MYVYICGLARHLLERVETTRRTWTLIQTTGLIGFLDLGLDMSKAHP